MEVNTMVETAAPEAMTAAELAIACRNICTAVGPGTRASLVISSEAYSCGDKASIIVNDREYRQLGHFQGDSFSEAFSAANTWASTHKAVRRNAIVRRMALAVMEVTDEHGACTETLLRGKDFTGAEIVEFHEAACVRAGEMAGNMPFAVLF